MNMRRQRGQIVWLMALCAIPIALGIAYLFNSAELLSRKVRAQNAADAAALSQASWVARSMNVMATNNVAFTQTEAVLVAGSAVTLTAIDLSQYIVREGITQVRNAIATCPFVVTAIACAKAVGTLVLLYASARELEDILALVNPIGGGAMDEFAGHADAFAESNDQLALHFAAFSADMQQSLARSNGISDAPRMMAVGWHTKPDMQPNLLSTRLPVERIELWDFKTPDSKFAQIWQLLRPVQGTGYKGTHSELFWPVARNFKDHGFEDGKGPWEAARDEVKDALEDSERYARITGWSATNPAQETPDYDDCWDKVASVPMVPQWFAPCTRGVLAGDTVRLYGPASAPNQNADKWGITDILVVMKSTRERGYVAPKRFANGLPATYGLAKARVYSATRADLYSSDWRATLVPIIPWENDRPVVSQELRTALTSITAAKEDDSLATYLSRISNQELGLVLSR